jgi:hypothetical protein
MSHDETRPIGEAANPSLSEAAAGPGDVTPPVRGGPGEEPQRPPLDQEVLEDWRWVFKGREEGRFDEYRGKHIAVVGKKVVGSDDNPMQLRYTLADALGLDRERLVIVYIEGPFGY